MQRHGWTGRGDYIYFIATKRMVKIGYSGKILDRLRNLAAQSPTPIRLLAAAPGGTDLERKLHRRFSADQIKGEWFQLSEPIKALVREAKKSGTFVDIG